MIKIYVDSELYTERHLIIEFLENEITELRCYYDFEIIEDENIENFWVDYNASAYFNGLVLGDKIRNVLSGYLLINKY